MEIYPGSICAPTNNQTKGFRLFDANRFYSIPRFQRPYSWTKMQRMALLTAVEETLAIHTSCYPLPEILLQGEGLPIGQQIYEVGDGQQRITSITLLLLAIWRIGSERNCEWVERILPPHGSALGASGLLGEIVQDGDDIFLQDRLAFQAEEPSDELEKLRTASNDEFLALRSADEAERGRPLTPAFFEFYDKLRGESDLHLEELLNAIEEKIIFPCYVFGPSENMHRSFGRMNSLGVPLRSSELIKADFYGVAKEHRNATLGDKIATHWTNKYENAFWSQIISGAKHSYLDQALLRILEEELNFPTASNRSWHQVDKGDYTHWLAEKWRERLAGVKSSAELASIFERLKTNLEWYRKTYDKNVHHEVGSLDWHVRELYEYLGSTGSGQTFGLILRLLRALPDEEKKDGVILLQKYATAFWLVNEKIKLLNHLNFKDSIFQRTSFTLLQLENFLKRRWPSKSELRTVLKVRNYSKPEDARALVRAFTYADNAIAISDVYEKRPLRSLATQDWHREHILAQSNRHWPRNLTSTQESVYRDAIDRIGNTFVLADKKNSSLGDKAVADKIKIYCKRPMSPTLINWYESFQVLYSVDHQWTPKEITARTKLLADFFAELLSSAGNLEKACEGITPYSDGPALFELEDLDSDTVSGSK